MSHSHTLVITRPDSFLASDGQFKTDIQKLGWNFISIPVFEYLATRNSELKKTLEDCAHGKYTWHIFTSPHAVSFFSTALQQENLTVKFQKIAAQGPGTARELKEIFHRDPDLIPEQFISEALAEKLVGVLTEKDSVLIPGSSESRRVIFERLCAEGISVEQVDLYSLAPIFAPLETEIPEGAILLFFSPSAVTGFIKRLGAELSQKLLISQVISIGPITTRTLKTAGFTNILEAREHSEAGVLTVLSSLKSM